MEYAQIVRRKSKKLRTELMQNYGENNSKKIMQDRDISPIDAF